MNIISANVRHLCNHMGWFNVSITSSLRWSGCRWLMHCSWVLHLRWIGEWIMMSDVMPWWLNGVARGPVIDRSADAQKQVKPATAERAADTAEVHLYYIHLLRFGGKCVFIAENQKGNGKGVNDVIREDWRRHRVREWRNVNNEQFLCLTTCLVFME